MALEIPSLKATEGQRRNDMCGVIAISDTKNDVAESIRWGLFVLNHRGEESAGIATSNENTIYCHKEMGLTETVFSMETKELQEKTKGILHKLKGKKGIGHVRYSTKGESHIKNAQPIIMKFHDKSFAIAHNGQIGNKNELLKICEKNNFKLKGNSDTEIIGALISLNKKEEFTKALIDVLKKLQGTFSLVLLYQNKIFAARDKFGNRPLSLGKTDHGFIISSESPVFNVLDGVFIRDVLPGEMIIMDEAGINSVVWESRINPKFCIFELIYFGRPDTKFLNSEKSISAKQYRKKLGELLAEKYPLKEADIIIPIMDSGYICGVGFSKQSGIEIDPDIVRSKYGVRRTFILKDDLVRKRLQKLKHGLISQDVKNKIVVIADDSIVRANTIGRIIKDLRKAQVKQIHVRISCPPIKHPCFYGIDMQTQEELIAGSLTIEEICKKINADSLEYLDYNSMIEATGLPEKNFCTACFNGKYPIPCEQIS